MPLSSRVSSTPLPLIVFLALLCGLLLPATTYAQSEYKPGTVVLLPWGAETDASADTLHGEIRYREARRTPRSVTFRPEGESRTTTYDAGDLASFSIGDRQYIRRTVSVDQRPTTIRSTYIPPERSFRNKALFLLRVVHGPLTLYSYEDARSHMYLETESGDVNELIFYARRVQKDDETLVGVVRRYREQLEDAKTEACRTLSTESLSFSVRDVAEFVDACNGPEGSIATSYLNDRSALRFSHAFGLSRGVGTIRHDYRTGYTAPGTSVGLSYRLFVSRNRSFNHFSGFAGLRLSHVNYSATQRDTTVDTPPVLYKRVEQTTTRATLLGLEIGTRSRVRIGSVHPYLDLSVQGRYAVAYDADIERSLQEFLIRDGSPELVRNRALEGQANPWDAIQIGFQVGTGVQWRGLSVGLEGLRGVPSSSGGRVQTPSFWQGAVTVAYEL